MNLTESEFFAKTFGIPATAESYKITIEKQFQELDYSERNDEKKMKEMKCRDKCDENFKGESSLHL